MEILNFTLVVQAFNFLLAYLLLNKFFWKPLAAAMEVEDTERASLMAKVEAEGNRLEQWQKYKADRWYEYQVEFSKQKPTVDLTKVFVLQSKIDPYDYVKIDEQFKVELVGKLENLFINRVGNVH